MKIRIEATQDGQEWQEAQPVGEGDMLGSLTDLTNGRDIYLFGWREGRPGVWRAVGGVDTEVGQLRKLETVGLEEISDLHEPYECPVVSPGMGLVRVRWSVVK
jgi:hypothetical protein